MNHDKTQKKLHLSINEDRIKDLDVSELEVESGTSDPVCVRCGGAMAGIPPAICHLILLSTAVD